MKVRKVNPLTKKPYQMTSRCPENRVGTRTHRNYTMHMVSGNDIGGGRVGALAKPRQSAKAFKLYCQDATIEAVQGRVIRAVMRAIWEDVGARCDAMYYGHP